jgi:hypothetical protein
LPLLCLTLIFLLFGGGFPSRHDEAGTFSATAPGQPQDAKPLPPEKPQSDSPQQVPTLPAASPTKQAPKPKRVITNDDLKGSGAASFGFTAADFSRINDCDRNCFEQVRQLTHALSAENSRWKRDVLRAIDEVRKDDEWQKYLRDLYEVHVKFCQVGNDKKEEIAKNADPRNVTPREIAIDEKYDIKFKEVQSELQAVYDRQDSLQRKFGGNYAYQFTVVQASRIHNAGCVSPSYPNYSPPDANDP